MRIMLEPIPNGDMDADTIYQLAGYALNHCRVHIEFDDGDLANGEARPTFIERYRTDDEPQGTYVDEDGEVIG